MPLCSGIRLPEEQEPAGREEAAERIRPNGGGFFDSRDRGHFADLDRRRALEAVFRFALGLEQAELIQGKLVAACEIFLRQYFNVMMHK